MISTAVARRAMPMICERMHLAVILSNSLHGETSADASPAHLQPRLRAKDVTLVFEKIRRADHPLPGDLAEEHAALQPQTGSDASQGFGILSAAVVVVDPAGVEGREKL